MITYQNRLAVSVFRWWGEFAGGQADGEIEGRGGSLAIYVGMVMTKEARGRASALLGGIVLYR